ncbi:phage tail tube protein [Natronosalvus rutilus]|uniref:Phage tail tube protein n=1 Tax=Natronosalvus rutilus TaxID=2953753 RepID=A0A9E7NFE2_9EURY|nr:phage tail tube protein [Natronosalvus rutilus]UTF55984.1 phage tail tube protein [Natronosalvus rutilus]
MSTQPHPYKAELTQIALAIEGQQKTEVVPTRYPGFLSGDQDMTDPEIDWQEGRYVGADRDPHDHTEGQHSFDGGSWTIHPYDGFPIAWAMGSETVTVDDPEAGLTTHTIERLHDGAPPTATVEGAFFGRGSQEDLVNGFLGVYPDTATIQQDNEGKLEVTTDLIGLGLTPDTQDGTRSAVDVSLPDRQPWRFSKVDSNLELAFGAGAQSFARVIDFSLEIANNATAEHYIEESEGNEPYELLYGNGGYSLEVEIAVTDNSIYQEMADPTQGGFDTSITFVKDSNETLEIRSTGCRMEGAPHGVPEEGKIEVPITILPRQTTITVVDSESDGTGYLEAGTPA